MGDDGFMGSMTTPGSRQRSATKAERLSRMIELYENLLFGLTLFSDCMAAYYHDQPNIFTLNENTFQDIKRRINTAIAHAREVLQKAGADGATKAEPAHFEYPSFTDHPLIDRIMEQAQILVGTFERMFPGRSRSDRLSHGELVSLMVEAMEQFELLKTAERISNFTKEIN